MPARPKNISNNGKGFEGLISKLAQAYAARWIATLEKVEPPVRVIGFGPARKVIFLKNPFLDYVGTWTAAGGRAIFIEGKSTAEDRLPLLGRTEDGKDQKGTG